MHVRVVKFTGVSAERLDATLARIKESDGPPPGIPTTGLQMLYDADQQTVVVLQTFDTAEDLKVGDQVFDAMDVGDTPGTRASVDRCELMLDLKA